MSFRGPDQNIFDIIRTLQERVDLLERGTGSVRQNTIRMGNWVLEPIDDALVKMTNLVTGIESYIGAPSDTTSNLVAELPPLSFGGLIRNNFVDDMSSLIYPIEGTGTVNTIDVTLKNLDSAGINTGPTFKIWVDGVGVYTSPRITTNYIRLTGMALTLVSGSQVYATINDDGIGDAIGLTIVMRYD